MGPTQMLMKEHRLIEQVLNCVEKMVAEARTSARLNKSNADKAIDFIKNFSDKCHHNKEEVHLFKMMEERGFSPYQGPTAVMRQEHDFGRHCVKQMVETIDGAASGDKTALAKFSENALEFVYMLRAHIQKEDGKLYPMANSVFSDEDQDHLTALFAKEDANFSQQEKYIALATELAKHYGVEIVNLDAVEDCGSGLGGCSACGG